MSQKYEQILRESVEKLQLGPDDIIIVKSPEAMSTFLEMTQQGVGFSKYSNPILLVPGGLEKASRQDLLEALSVVDQHIAARGEQTDQVSRVITDLRAPVLRKVQ
jgi:hypothetical protein